MHQSSEHVHCMFDSLAVTETVCSNTKGVGYVGVPNFTAAWYSYASSN